MTDPVTETTDRVAHDKEQRRLGEEQRALLRLAKKIETLAHVRELRFKVFKYADVNVSLGSHGITGNTERAQAVYAVIERKWPEIVCEAISEAELAVEEARTALTATGPNQPLQ